MLAILVFSLTVGFATESRRYPLRSKSGKIVVCHYGRYHCEPNILQTNSQLVPNGKVLIT